MNSILYITYLERLTLPLLGVRTIYVAQSSINVSTTTTPSPPRSSVIIYKPIHHLLRTHSVIQSQVDYYAKVFA